MGTGPGEPSGGGNSRTGCVVDASGAHLAGRLCLTSALVVMQRQAGSLNGSSLPSSIDHWQALAQTPLAMRWNVMVCGVGLLFGFAASGAELSTKVWRRVTLAECVQLALQRNRQVQIEQINPRIARLTLDSAQGIYDPTFYADARHQHHVELGQYDPRDFSHYDPHDFDSEGVLFGLQGYLPSGLSYRIGTDYSHAYGVRDAVGIEQYRLQADISVRQPLLRNFWTDQPRTTIRLNKKNLRITELGVNYVIMNVISQVERAYYELACAAENVKVLEKLLAVRQQFAADTRRQISVGALPPTEERLAQARVARAEADLILGRNTTLLTANALKTLLGDDFTGSPRTSPMPADTLLVVPEDLNLQASWQRGLAQRPDLIQFRVEIEKEDLNLRFRRNQLYPTLDIVAGYGRLGSSAFTDASPVPPPASASHAFDQVLDGVAPHDLIGVLFALPLTRAAERANYRLSKELKEQAVLRLKQREELVLREVSDAVQTAQAERERVQAARQTAEYAQLALAAEQQKLAVGQSTFYVVLELQGELAAAQAAEIRARADYNGALSRLHLAEASVLERHQINVEYR